MNCPKCIGKLQKTTVNVTEASDVKDLRGAALSYNLELDQCFVCGGVWCDKGELDKYMTEGIKIVDSGSVGSELDEQLDKKIGKCPRCNIAMTKKKSSINPNITVDTCPKCEGIWLDSTEIDRLEAGKHKMSKKGAPNKIAKAFSSLLFRRRR